jgi:hypothetical protein
VNSTPSSNEPEIVSVARAKAEYIKAEMMAEFKRLDAGETQLTPAVVKTFERKWKGELKELDDRIFTASVSPGAEAYVSPLEEMRKELAGFIDQYIQALTYHYVREGNEAPAEPAEDEKARQRAERRARMEKFQRGEKPD